MAFILMGILLLENGFTSYRSKAIRTIIVSPIFLWVLLGLGMALPNYIYPVLEDIIYLMVLAICLVWIIQIIKGRTYYTLKGRRYPESHELHAPIKAYINAYILEKGLIDNDIILHVNGLLSLSHQGRLQIEASFEEGLAGYLPNKVNFYHKALGTFGLFSGLGFLSYGVYYLGYF